MAISHTTTIAEAYANPNAEGHGVASTDLALAMHYGRCQEPIAILKRPPLPPPQMFTGYSHLLAQLRPDIQAKLSRLCEAAATLPLRLYLVGGAVRDLLLNQDTNDLDLVVDHGTAADLTMALAALAPDIDIQRHDRYFTAVLRWTDGTAIDLVTARQETYAAAAAHPEVTPATLLADLKRRDFTINALALGLSGDQTGCLIDPFGGLADLEAGYLRTLHANSFYEDPTRLVRGARFAARFGFQLPEPCQIEVKAAVQSLSRSIWQVDYGRQDDRLKHEWAALLTAEYWQAAIKLLEAWGGLTYLSCQAEGATVIQSCQRYRYWRQYWQQRGTDTYPDLAAVVQHCAPTVQAALLPTVEFNCSLLSSLASAVTQHFHHLEPAAIILLASREERGVRWLCWQYLRHWRHTKPLLNGHDLAVMGYPRGPLYKEILKHLLAAQLDQHIEPTPEAARQWVATHFPLPNQLEVDPNKRKSDQQSLL